MPIHAPTSKPRSTSAVDPAGVDSDGSQGGGDYEGAMLEAANTPARRGGHVVDVATGHPTGDFYQATVAASNTGPSTQTRFIAVPSGVLILTAHPAQPPTAQAMNSSRETWQGSA